MKKILTVLAFGIVSSSVFASDLDMNNLKCNDLQIYSNTTLQDIKAKCKVTRESWMSRQNERNLPSKYWFGQDKMFEIHFYSTSNSELVRCDFLNNSPEAKVVGCR